MTEKGPSLYDFEVAAFSISRSNSKESSPLKRRCVKNSSAAVPREKNGSQSDNHGKAQAGCAGFVLGVRRRTGTDPSKDAAIAKE